MKIGYKMVFRSKKARPSSPFKRQQVGIEFVIDIYVGSIDFLYADTSCKFSK